MLHPEGIIALLTACKEAGITTCVETCGEFSPIHLPALREVTDLFLWDVKDTDPNRHRRNTGGALETVLHNLRAADALGANTRLRCILLSGVNLTNSHLAKLSELYHSLQHCEGIELLPYHTYGDSKNTQLGRASAAHPEWVPAEAQIEHARTFIAQHAVLIRG